MNRFGKVPSSEIIRQAREEIYGLTGLDTKRPETPRHPRLLDQYHHGSGDKTQLDKFEPRPQTAKIRLDPLNRADTPKTKKRATSAQQKFDQVKNDFCRMKIKERHQVAEKLARTMERVEGEMSAHDRELLLTKCKEILDLNATLSNEQRLAVCRILLQMKLGSNNLAVLGDTLVALTENPTFVAAHPIVVNGIIGKLDTANIHFCVALSQLIQTDCTLQQVVKHSQLMAQLRRCLELLLAENDGKNQSVFGRVKSICSTMRSLLDVATFFNELERRDNGDSVKLVELWVTCCAEFADQAALVHLAARLLSKATESDIVCSHLTQPTASLVLASASETYVAESDTLVRLLYALGNCLAVDGRCRQNNAKLLQSMRRVFRYGCKRVELMGSNTDVLLKMIRLIANFALDESGAVAILADQVIIKALLWLLKLSVEDDKLVDITKYALAALNNLVYYAKGDFEPYLGEATGVFVACLMKSNLAVTAECCRALGNLSHFPLVVEQFEDTGADKILHALLDAANLNLVVNVIGIFINFTLQRPDLPIFVEKQCEGIFKLLRAMREFNECQLSTLTLQLIWNLLRNVTEIRSQLKSEISSTIDFINEHAESPIDMQEAQEQRLFGEISEKVMEIVGNR